MVRFLSSTLVGICALLLVFQLTPCKAKDQLEHEAVDAFKAFENFPYAIALYDIDKDGDLDCLTAIRTEFNKDPLSATYVLFLKGLNGHNAYVST
ncbi:hypothetical protein V5799_004165 [Amblyomma americanum]|uniref:Lipocalin-5 1 n=1 Tax=Amblyomma americanum TaxID=6943 RepID=A0AAQ4D6W5_AMBAM